MATVTITALSYDSDHNTLLVDYDVSELAVTPSARRMALKPQAIGNRIAKDGYTDGDAALTGIVLEHAARLAPDASGTTVDWQSPSDEEKASQLDAQADAIEAARVFFGGTP